MVLRNCESSDNGLIRLDLMTNAVGIEKESLHAAQGGSVSFSKEKQIGFRPEKAKKGISSRSKKKESRFDSVYQAYYEACQKNGYDVPAKHYSNRNIDNMIEAYGPARFAELVACAVENWPKITEIVKNFEHRPVPTLGEISLPFVCEHLNAHLVDKEKGLLNKNKEKPKNKTQRVKKSDTMDEAKERMKQRNMELFLKDKKVI